MHRNLTLNRDRDFDTWIHPRDIFTPAATLLGLVIAAIGLASTIAGIASILRALSLVLIVVVILFAAAAIATCVSTLRRSHRLFRVGIVLFGLGWAFTALVVSIFLIGYTWGISVFQITVPRVPSLDIAALISIVFSIISGFAALWSYQKNRIDTRQLTKLVSEFPPHDAWQSQEILRQTLEGEINDPKMAFVKLTIDIERVLRSKAKSLGYTHGPYAPLPEVINFLLSKNAISSVTAASLREIRMVRNAIVHSGGDVSSEEATKALNLAAIVLSGLSEDARYESDR